MKKLLLLFSMFTASILYAAVLHAEPVYYVQSANAKIWIGTSFTSKVIAEVKRGQLLTSTGQDGRWTKVRFEGKDGYIPTLLLSTHPPLNRTVIIKADDTEIKQGVRRRASSYSSAAAARGLTKEDRKRADAEEGTNFSALNKMESLSFSDDDVEQFMKGGKL